MDKLSKLTNTEDKFVVRVEFPDEDLYAYDIVDGLMGRQLRIFYSYGDADEYARKKYPHSYYNIEKI